MIATDRPVALVTGAASGMGYTTALAFLKKNYHVIGIDLVAPEIAEGSSKNFTAVPADVRSLEQLRNELTKVLPDDQPIQAVANIAGIYPPTTLETYDADTYRRIFDVNILGVLNVTKAARPYLNRGSAVVNFSSADAFDVSPGQLLYGASKAAVVMITKSLALELAPDGIRVNGVAPGWVNTPGNAATGRMTAAATGIPLGRVAQPEEISQWVCALCDESFAGYMTGETLLLTGGDVLR